MSDEPDARRVLLVDCVGLLGDVIRRTVGRHDDIVVVDDVDAGRMPAGVARSRPDVVIWNLGVTEDDAVVGDLTPVFGEQVRARVVVAYADSERWSLSQLRPTRIPLGELSPDSLVQVIRGGIGG